MRLFVSALALVLCAASAYAAGPLVIVRFNQKTVSFEQQTFKAVQEAVRVKADVRFRVVFMPPAANADAPEIEMQKSRVLNTLTSIGVPPSRVHTALQPRAGVDYLEAQIFAE